MKIWKLFSRYGSSIMGIAAALGVGIVIGSTALFGNAPESATIPAPIESDAPSEAAGKIGIVSILPTTKVEWKYRFTECGHELTASGGEDIIGYTLSDIAETYPDSRVTEMSAEYTAIERIISEYCPEHYVLVWTGEETLSVFQTDAESLAVQELMELPLDREAIDDSLLEPLRDGLAFDSLMDINEYLEDAES